MDEITILPVLTAQDLVFIMFLPGELQAGDRLFNLSRRDQLLILSEPGSSLSFAVNLQAEASLRMAREVMLVEAADTPRPLGKASLLWHEIKAGA